MADQPYALPDLPYDYAALEPHISGHVMELHHDKHHAAYVNGANETLEKLQAVGASCDFATISMLERDLAFHVSGHVLHSVLWTNLSPDSAGQPDPSSALVSVLDDTFGGFDRFRSQMTEAATKVQGSGWAVASWEPVAGRIVLQQVHDHQGNHAQGTVPLLAIDAWEHAFYLQYENRKAEFFEALWNIVNWSDVQARFDQARQPHLDAPRPEAQP